MIERAASAWSWQAIQMPLAKVAENMEAQNWVKARGSSVLVDGPYPPTYSKWRVR